VQKLVYRDAIVGVLLADWAMQEKLFSPRISIPIDEIGCIASVCTVLALNPVIYAWFISL